MTEIDSITVRTSMEYKPVMIRVPLIFARRVVPVSAEFASCLSHSTTSAIATQSAEVSMRPGMTGAEILPVTYGTLVRPASQRHHFLRESVSLCSCDILTPESLPRMYACTYSMPNGGSK